MKRAILSMALLVAIGTSAFAQVNDVEPKAGRGWYIGTGVSYFFKVTPVEFPNVGPFQPRDHYEELNPANPTGLPLYYSDKTITGSFGEGWRGSLSGGYMFTKYFGLQVDVNYFGGRSQLMRRNVVIIPLPSGNQTVVNSVAEGDVRALILAPSFVFSLGNTGQLQPYARFGAVLPVYGYLQIETNIIDNRPGNPLGVGVIARTEKVRPRPTIGFQGALGFNYPVGKTKVFLEMEYNNVAVGGKEKEVTAYSETRTNPATGQVTQIGLNDLPLGLKFVDYEETITSSSNTEYTAIPTAPGTTGTTVVNPNFDPNQKAQELRSYINIGGLGLTLGVRFRF